MLTNFIVVIFHNIYMYQVILLYILNLHNGVCQLYLNKAGKTKNYMLISLLSTDETQC